MTIGKKYIVDNRSFIADLTEDVERCRMTQNREEKQWKNYRYDTLQYSTVTHVYVR